MGLAAVHQRHDTGSEGSAGLHDPLLSSAAAQSADRRPDSLQSSKTRVPAAAWQSSTALAAGNLHPDTAFHAARRARSLERRQAAAPARTSGFGQSVSSQSTGRGGDDAIGRISAVEPGDWEGRQQEALGAGVWGLDRIDQRWLPLDGVFRYGGAHGSGRGRGATIYVVDSGVDVDHAEFGMPWDLSIRRATSVEARNASGGGEGDCGGHGTLVASVAAGRLVGVAKEAAVVGVRVLSCWQASPDDVAAGLDWVSANARKPAVAVLALGMRAADAPTLAAVVQRLLDAGVTVVAAAGAAAVAANACDVAPANVGGVIAAAASGLDALRRFDVRFAGGSGGPCVAVYAPGVDVLGACSSRHGSCSAKCGEARPCWSADGTPSSGYVHASGSSLAAAFVAGVAAVYLGDHRSATPAQVKDALLRSAGRVSLVDENAQTEVEALLLNSWVRGKEEQR